ncbi:MAG: ABC transporter permease [Bradyrhizobium sp.]|nr:MAG: ABC transporter permease [Bradyrhizobium sp.]
MTRNRQQSSSSGRVAQFLSVWGLLIVLLALIALFSILKPNTFATAFNLQAILSNKSISAMAALAAMIPIAANRFDLSVAFTLGISQVLAIGLQEEGLPWPLAVALVLGLGALTGLCNGILVTVVGIDSFIATLGTGTVLLGVNQWYTGGHQVITSLPDSFIALSSVVFGIPIPALYVLAISLAMWVVFEYLPIGRFIYVLGINPRAAQLNGISERKYITGVLIASGVISAWAGVVLQSQLQVGQSSVGQEYLLPAFTAVLLGATAIKPGRVNVWGTILAVGVLAVTVAGLNQLGAPYFVEALFNGATLILAVGLAVTANRRKTLGGSIADGALPVTEATRMDTSAK